MIISDEQAKRAVEYLRSSRGGTSPQATSDTISDPPDELIEKVRHAIAETPETREDRVREATRHLSESGFSGTEVADKMIARIVSDSLR